MSNLVLGLLSALMATNQPVAVSNLIHARTGMAVEIVDSNDPVEKGYQRLMAADDESQAEVDQWIRENQAFSEGGGGVAPAELNRRILARFAGVRRGYEIFLDAHTNHVRARIAYGSFLGDIGDQEGAEREWDLARQIDPKNAAAWNNLANHYGHFGDVPKAFEYYEKAIELSPSQSVYYQNLATTVYLFRPDAIAYYKISEPQVFDKALALYRRALQLDPANFPLASDLAQSYYVIKPMRTEEALSAWTNALQIAGDDIEREGVEIHFARIKLNAGRFDEARAHLNLVTNAMYTALKRRIMRNIDEKEHPQPNDPPVAPVLTPFLDLR